MTSDPRTRAQDVLALLVTPTTDATPAREVDDIREDAITMARIQLANLYDPPDADDDNPVTSVPPSMPWIQMTHCMTLAGVAHGFVIAQDDQAGVHGTARLIKELNAFLRQTLIQCTVDYHVMKMTSIPQVTPWLPLLYLARDRAIAALDRSNIDPRIVAPATGGQVRGPEGSGAKGGRDHAAGRASVATHSLQSTPVTSKTYSNCNELFLFLQFLSVLIRHFFPLCDGIRSTRARRPRCQMSEISRPHAAPRLRETPCSQR